MISEGHCRHCSRFGIVNSRRLCTYCDPAVGNLYSRLDSAWWRGCLVGMGVCLILWSALLAYHFVSTGK